MSYGVTQWGTSPSNVGESTSSFQSGFGRLPRSWFLLFVGEHEHSLDSKGRVVLPVDYRSLVVDKGYIVELDDCLGLWSEEGFEKFSAEIIRRRDAQQISIIAWRRMFAGVSEVKLDSAGRVSLPKAMRESQGFGSQVVVAGALTRVEIWPAERYRALHETADAKAEVAEAIRSFL